MSDSDQGSDSESEDRAGRATSGREDDDDDSSEVSTSSSSTSSSLSLPPSADRVVSATNISNNKVRRRRSGALKSTGEESEDEKQHSKSTCKKPPRKKRRIRNGGDTGSGGGGSAVRTRRSRDARKRERQDIHDALEHLVVVGNAWRHHDWRRKHWRNVARPEEVRYRQLLNGRQGRRLVHPRDAREYHDIVQHNSRTLDEENGEHRRRQAEDDEWDSACFGDGIRLQQFYDRSMNHADHCPIRTLVLRSWERAMSIASSTVLATAPAPMVVENEGDSMSVDECEQVAPATAPQTLESASNGSLPHGRLLTRAMGLEQCELLNLCLENPGSGVCRTCGVEFDTEDRVLDHYYGDDKVRGCCWILIRREQERLIRQALKDQVDDQLALLLRSVAAASVTSAPAAGSSWDWQDVVGAVELATRTRHDGAAPGDRHSPSAVDAATRRLVERYANIPR